MNPLGGARSRSCPPSRSRFSASLASPSCARNARDARPVGCLSAGRIYRHPSPAGDYRADPGRGHRPPRRLRLRPVAWLLLLDDRADHRLARRLLGRPLARCRVRSGPGGAAGVGAHGLPRRGRGRHSLLHHLPDPGLPKDIVCYLFGVSPMPFWVFAVMSTLGRMPGTWALSAQGAKAAAGEYVELLLLTALVVAVALPLYYYRSRIVAWFQGRG